MNEYDDLMPHHCLANTARRYWELTRLMAEARRATAPLHDELVAAILAYGEPITVAGLPTLRLVERRSGRLWDVKALAAKEPREFQRLLELGCLTVEHKLAEAQVTAGNLSGMHRNYSWETHTSALVFDAGRLALGYQGLEAVVREPPARD